MYCTSSRTAPLRTRCGGAAYDAPSRREGQRCTAQQDAQLTRRGGWRDSRSHRHRPKAAEPEKIYIITFKISLYISVVLSHMSNLNKSNSRERFERLKLTQQGSERMKLICVASSRRVLAQGDHHHSCQSSSRRWCSSAAAERGACSCDSRSLLQPERRRQWPHRCQAGSGHGGAGSLRSGARWAAVARAACRGRAASSRRCQEHCRLRHWC